jgi:hypothetical protein
VLPTAHFRARAEPRAGVVAATAPQPAEAEATPAAAAAAAAAGEAPVKRKVQPQDFTTLVAAVEEIRRDWCVEPRFTRVWKSRQTKGSRKIRS